MDFFEPKLTHTFDTGVRCVEKFPPSLSPYLDVSPRPRGVRHTGAKPVREFSHKVVVNSVLEKYKTSRYKGVVN